MLLIPMNPIISPRQAERLMAALWQQSAGATLALFLIGRGDRDKSDEPTVILGAASPNPLVEEDAADVIARAVDAPIEPGFVLEEEILSAPYIGVRHITPVFRDFKADTRSWGWDRADNLHDTFDMLGRVPPGRIAGFGLAFRTLPGLLAATSMLVFAASSDEHESQREAYALASTFAGTGARVSRLLNPRRFLRRTLRAQVATTVSWLRPHSVIRVEEMSAFWLPRLSEQRARCCVSPGRPRSC